MKGLLKADFYTLYKSKLTLILLGICIGLPLITVFMYLGIKVLIESKILSDSGLEGLTLFTGRTIMFSNFALSSNVGLFIPIFAGILTVSDIRNGTVRSKVLLGESRQKIYFSHLTVSTVFCVVMSLVSFAILTLGSALFFEYGAEWNAEEVGNFFRCLIIGLLAFVYAASLSVFFSLVTKSMPLTIVLTVLTCIGLGIVSSLSSLIPDDRFKYLFYLIPTYASTTVASTGMISTEAFWFGLASFLVFIAGHTVAGIILFKKSDLK